jgi:hypothetical protein
MALSIFENKSLIPAESAVAKKLGSTYPIWEGIKKFVFEKYEGAAEEWKFTGKNYGWGFRLKDKKRVIIYMTPQKGYFIVALIFGDKAYKEILKSGISEDIKQTLGKARVYVEGRGIRIEVHNNEPVRDIKQLIEIKLKN